MSKEPSSQENKDSSERPLAEREPYVPPVIERFPPLSEVTFSSGNVVQNVLFGP